MTYDEIVAELLVLTQYNANDPNFTANLPVALTYAQNRIDRELNLLNTVTGNNTLLLTAGSRHLDITPANINVLSDVNIITPVTAPGPNMGTRNPATICSKEWLAAVYGSSQNPGVPQWFALSDDVTLLFGPWPDHAYRVELVGTVRPLTLSETNQTTWVSVNIPDVLLAACMIWMSAFKHNFGSQADDPKMAVSWETQYQTLSGSARVEDLRRKFQSEGWTSDLPNKLNPPRT